MSIAFERLKEETTKFDPHFVVGVQLVKYLEVENCKQLNLICILLSLNAIPFLVYRDRDVDVNEADDTGLFLVFVRGF